jgi:photosystem II stability/assembly factor-like uncharacterized protein
VHDGRLFAASHVTIRNVSHGQIFTSDDLGAHFVPASRHPDDATLGGFAAVGDALFVGSSGATSPGGVFRSDDGGRTWDRANNGLAARFINDVAVDPLQPGVLYAKASNHLFRSRDDGATWQISLPSDTVFSFGGNDLLADPTVPGRVWNASFYLERSDDAGARWTMVRPVSFPVETLAADPGAPRTVWVGGGAGLFVSNGGRAWKRVRPSPGDEVGVTAIAVDPLDPQVVWVAGWSIHSGVDAAGRLFRSGDGGATWEPRDTGLPIQPATSLIPHPAAAGTIFAAAGAAMYRSHDAGVSWQKVPAPLPDDGSDGSWRLAIAPGAQPTLYALRLDLDADGVFATRDEGATWRRLGASDRGWGRTPLRTLTVDPLDPRRIFAGTAQRGVFVWTEP